MAAKLARQAAGQRHNNTRVDVGIRMMPQTTATPPATKADAEALCYPAGDDLDGMWFRDQLLDGILVSGDVLHLYVFEHAAPGDEAYLDDIVCVWMGYGEHEPQIIDPRFVTFPDPVAEREDARRTAFERFGRVGA
jgi:hypothetical protein